MNRHILEMQNYLLSVGRGSKFVRQVYNLCVPLQESFSLNKALGPFSTFFYCLSKWHSIAWSIFQIMCSIAFSPLCVCTRTWMEVWFVSTVTQRKHSWFKTELLLKGGMSSRGLGWVRTEHWSFHTFVAQLHPPLCLSATGRKHSCSYSFFPPYTSAKIFLLFFRGKDIIHVA